MMLVAAQVSVLGLYLPPVLKVLLPLDPPHTIISPPGVQRAQTVAIVSAPHDHFTTSPDCPMNLSGIGRVGGVCSCPSVGSEIVFAAGVGIAGARDVSAPDDHFTAGPHCGVTVAGSRRVGDAGGSPRVVGAATRRAGYHRKRVVGAHCRH